MKRLLVILVPLVLIAAAPFVLGALAPASFEIRVARHIDAERPAVFALLANLDEWVLWRRGFEDVEILEPHSGELVRYRLTTEHETLTYAVVDFEENRLITTCVAEKDVSFDGCWRLEFDDSDGGTLITLNEKGRINSLWYRFMSRYVIGHHKYIEGFFDDIEAALG